MLIFSMVKENCWPGRREGISRLLTTPALMFNEVDYKGVARNFSRGGLPSHFSIFRGGGAQPRFLVASMVKMKEFSGQGGHGPPCLCLPTPLVDYV